MNRFTPVARVPGEDVPLLLPLGLTLLATLFASAAVNLWLADVRTTDVERPAHPTAVATAAEPMPTPIATELPSVASAHGLSLGGSAQAAPTPLGAETTPTPKSHCEALLVDFPSGAATPSKAATDELRKRAAFLLAEPDVSVVIDGHSDSLGSDELNLRLSKRRAETLAWVLQNAGVPRARITSRGFGAFLPIEGAAEAADINRRGVIHFRGGCPNDLTRKVDP